jgi:MFS transporter, DHA1 family, tetracycline resistance protein
MSAKRPVLRLFPVLVLNLIGFGIAIPVLPALAQDLGGDAVDVGLLYSIQALGQFVMAPMWGAISDRFGRKRTLIATFLTAAVFEVLTALTPTLLLLYLSRLLVGMCAGNVATASALIADATDAESRSKGMAVIGISFGIGFTLGAGLGGSISRLEQEGPGLLGSGLPFAVAAGIYLLTALVGAWLLVEPAKDVDERKKNRVRIGLRGIVRHLRRRSVQVMCAIFFFYTVAVAILEATFFLYAESIFGWDEFGVGMTFAGLGLLMALVQGGIGRISAWIGDRTMTGLGLVLLALGLAIAPTTGTLWFLLGFLGVATIGRALAHPGLLSLTSAASPEATQTGKIMGTLQSFGSLARIGAPALGGLVFREVGPQAPFWLAGALLLVASAWWWVATTASSDTSTS